MVKLCRTAETALLNKRSSFGEDHHDEIRHMCSSKLFISRKLFFRRRIKCSKPINILASEAVILISLRYQLKASPLLSLSPWDNRFPCNTYLQLLHSSSISSCKPLGPAENIFPPLLNPFVVRVTWIPRRGPLSVRYPLPGEMDRRELKIAKRKNCLGLAASNLLHRLTIFLENEVKIVRCLKAVSIGFFCSRQCCMI